MAQLLNYAVVWELLLLAVVIYTAVLQGPFGTFSLSVNDWVLVTALAVSVVPVLETVKWVERRGWLGQLAS